MSDKPKSITSQVAVGTCIGLWLFLISAILVNLLLGGIFMSLLLAF